MSGLGREELSGWRLRDYDHAVTVLTAARHHRGITLRELAAAAGCTGSTLSRGLRGVHRVDAHTLLAVADALGFDVALIPRDRL